MAVPTVEMIPVSDLAASYRGVVLDVFGVIHDGVSAFPGVRAALGQLQKRGIKTCLLSNSPRRADEVAKRLDAMGIGRDLYQGLITSGELTYQALNDFFEFPAGSSYFHIGPMELAGLTSGLPMNASRSLDTADFVLATGWPEDETLTGKLLPACLARRLPMICANPDLEVFIGDKKVICAGALARDYEMLGGRVISYGKPFQAAYLKALGVLCLSPEQTLAIGDSIATDIVGGQRAGLDTALVLTGVHKNCLTPAGGVDHFMLLELFRQHDVEPDFVLPSLGWPSRARR
ncbi:HAD superfamily hydrolase (TIGR01459 family) [Rhizobium sp. BK650]|uniref:TIGR01459 family HAD-type hydrolase n=1 Tax=Rhizobium sp. BK650 TaxID=2586990 RepID=UPI00160B9A81|nr:TIGR01459 family HAD-type hydrolase [Rhizobium sp. BK650]MBB3659725.1 HAD superfamily hydrolase (TIGR01459 family) [Rhizobium sp. BK650]